MDVVVLDVDPQGQRHGGPASVEEDCRAGYPLHGEPCVVQLFNEVGRRTLTPSPVALSRSHGPRCQVVNTVKIATAMVSVNQAPWTSLVRFAAKNNTGRSFPARCAGSDTVGINKISPGSSHENVFT